VAVRYLDEFARELEKIGERAFRKRHGVPVLIVSGRTAPVRMPRPAALMETARERPDAVRALISRVFSLAKAGSGSGPIVVGRALVAGVDVEIPDPSISKRHCEFTPVGSGGEVVDCGSTNGTAVNGAVLRGPDAVRLCGGEVLTLGRLEVTFETAAGFAELVSGLSAK
jgi:hypothetical protein